jgi:hypothetical protein
MLVSTALNLIVVPAMDLIIDEVGARISNSGRRKNPDAARPATAE